MEKKTAVVRARVSPERKARAERVLARIGVSPSQAINMFYIRIASDGAIPFSSNIPNAETRRAFDDIRAGRGTAMALREFARETRALMRGSKSHARRHLRARI